jgi:hypothetical protein
MRPVEIVDCAPLIEDLLRFGEIAETAECKHFSFQGPMEALVLASALGMMRPAVHNPDAELQQPHGQMRPGLAGGIAPGRAVVDEKRLRQPMVTERGLQSSLYGRALLVGAGGKADRVARMVIDDRQGMTTRLTDKRYAGMKIRSERMASYPPDSACIT